jgi:myosin-5
VAEQAALMSASQAPVVASLFAAPAGPGASAQGSHTTPHHSRHNTPLGSSGSAGGGALSLKSFKFDSVCAQFKRQLSDLMAALAVMQPHYVRCIKPNPASQPGVLDHAYVLQQLRCGGVMEAVRISCAGFAFRRPFAAFLEVCGFQSQLARAGA